MRVEVTDSEGLVDAITVTLPVNTPGEMRLPATEAILSPDTNIRFTGNMITHITHDDATATWTVTPAVTGEYQVLLFAGSPDDNVGRMTINGVSQDFPVTKTGAYNAVREHDAGRLQLTKGQSTQLTVSVVSRVDGLCDVSNVQLLPIVKSPSD